MIIEDVFIGRIKHGQHVKDALRHLGNQRLADLA